MSFIITKGIMMQRYILITLVMVMGFLNAADIQEIKKLEAEKKALELKLEAYTLKKKIIEMEMFFEKAKAEKEEKIEREKALIRFKNDIRAKRKVVNSAYKG